MAYAAVAAAVYATLATAADTPESNAERAQRGAALYATHCSACHGHGMKDPEVGFDLRKFPLGERERFVQTVTKGKGAMPPWGGLLKAGDIDDLWAYVAIGENK
jgi:mono/diheme cytochrome c family protein